MTNAFRIYILIDTSKCFNSNCFKLCSKVLHELKHHHVETNSNNMTNYTATVNLLYKWFIYFKPRLILLSYAVRIVDAHSNALSCIS